MVASQGGFGPQNMALLANLKAVLMCLIAFTNPSSGSSRCQCCMISVEHGLELLKAGLGLYVENVFKLFLHAVSYAWPAADWKRTPVTQGECDGGCSSGNKRLVTPTVVMFTLSDFTGSSRESVFGLSQHFHVVFRSHFLWPLSIFMSVKAAHKHTQTSRHIVLSFFLPLFTIWGWIVCDPGQLIRFTLFLRDSCFS